MRGENRQENAMHAGTCRTSKAESTENRLAILDASMKDH
jgi:hypothetical protein